MRVFTAGRELVREFSTGLTEAHGITAVDDEDGECVWVADPAEKIRTTDEDGRYEFVRVGAHGRVAKFTLDGRLVRELPVPSHPAYEEHRFAPTAVAAGTDRIWVADGYGNNLVHAFTADGIYESTLEGEFDCPHGLLLDRRGDEHELYVADRENSRIQVYGVDGVFRRTVGEGELRRPCSMATSGDLLLVAELEARLAVFDGKDGLVGYIGADDEAAQRPGWPNAETADGRTVRPPLRHGHFNSPHGLAVDTEGRPLVTEWLIGGRTTRLTARD
ncbi:hypothetical protein HCJ93_20525 [Streptomyces sp. SBST2-5]|uniref:Uncharacterized protein n=1 Tax=Streptomyces composti TaxID=2720025 RepID=A0ABX1ACJ6_9ACTN|nr:hypothetical protein [Streptomyces composti]NJP52374.1 hypothetical protein [Streptomyces composti]